MIDGKTTRTLSTTKNKKNGGLAEDVTLQLHAWDLKMYECN
jgi:hypothetical protein